MKQSKTKQRNARAQPFPPSLQQQVLEELDAEKRLNKALVLIKKELELGKIQQEIQQQVRRGGGSKIGRKDKTRRFVCSRQQGREGGLDGWNG
jgi:ATP-dependent Lon protease